MVYHKQTTNLEEKRTDKYLDFSQISFNAEHFSHLCALKMKEPLHVHSIPKIHSEERWSFGYSKGI